MTLKAFHPGFCWSASCWRCSLTTGASVVGPVPTQDRISGADYPWECGMACWRSGWHRASGNLNVLRGCHADSS